MSQQDAVAEARMFLLRVSRVGFHTNDAQRAKDLAANLDGVVVAHGIEALQNTDGRPAEDWPGCLD